MCFGTSKAPSAPTLPPPPPPPPLSAQAQGDTRDKASFAASQTRKKRKGLSTQTILTSPLGASASAAAPSAKTLLGM